MFAGFIPFDKVVGVTSFFVRHFTASPRNALSSGLGKEGQKVTLNILRFSSKEASRKLEIGFICCTNWQAKNQS
jgi:hypothetical protein